MARAGVLALEFFTPGKGSAGWGQAHMMARYAILRVCSRYKLSEMFISFSQVLLAAGENFVTLTKGEGDQKSGTGSFVTLDRSKVCFVFSFSTLLICGRSNLLV